MASLRELRLDANQIGDVGLTALAGAISTSGALPGALPALKKVIVPSGLEQHTALVAACKPRRIQIA
mgnify:CR=1 FL=1